MSLEASWRLPELMACAGYRHTSDLIEPLAARGIVLSRSQVYRLTRDPERVSLRVVAALCDIFSVGVEELITLRPPDAG